MKIKYILAIFLTVLAVSEVFGVGQAEGSGSNRGTFLSRGGYIIPADQVKIDQYIAQYKNE